MSCLLVPRVERGLRTQIVRRLLDGPEPGDVIEVTLTRERVIELERR